MVPALPEVNCCFRWNQGCGATAVGSGGFAGLDLDDVGRASSPTEELVVGEGQDVAGPVAGLDPPGCTQSQQPVRPPLLTIPNHPEPRQTHLLKFLQ